MPYIQTFDTRPVPADEQIGRAVCDSLNDYAQRKRAEQAYEQQLEANIAAQERLMEFEHQQRMQEMAYQQQLQEKAYQRQLESQKRVVVYHKKKNHTTNEAGTPMSSVIVFCVIAILFIVGIGALVLRKQASGI